MESYIADSLFAMNSELDYNNHSDSKRICKMLSKDVCKHIPYTVDYSKRVLTKLLFISCNIDDVKRVTVNILQCMGLRRYDALACVSGGIRIDCTVIDNILTVPVPNEIVCSIIAYFKLKDE